MKKFVMLDSHTLPDADFHQEKELLKGQVECVIACCKNKQDIEKIAKDANYIGTVYTKITAEILDLMPNLTLIIRYGIGYDVVDVNECSKRSIMVCNLPTYCIEDVASHAAALILDISRKTSILDREIRKGNWNPGFGYENHRLSVQTLGFIGFGHIAQQLSLYMRAFNMNMLAYDPYLKDEVFSKFNIKRVCLDELLGKSDVISLHCACTDETRHIINMSSLDKLKNKIIIINTSRGALIDNRALIAGLECGKILAAGLDVIEDEPIRNPLHELLTFDSVVITPHSAYNSVEASDSQHKDAANTVLEASQGKIPVNTVNKQTFKH